MFKVEVPTVLSPARGGLLPIANVITEDADTAAYHGVRYDGVPCGQSRPVPAEGVEKTFDTVPQIEGVEFGIYRGIDDPLLLGADTAGMARDLFGSGESHAVETAIQKLLLNPEAVDLTPTPGTPVTNAKAALGILEQYAAERYTGLPLLHADRYITALMEELQVDDSTWKLHTQQGTPLANGGGYTKTGPGGVEAPAGAGWLYISGQVNIWQGTVNVIEAAGLRENRNYALAEAAYAATVECFVAALLVGI